MTRFNQHQSQRTGPAQAPNQNRAGSPVTQQRVQEVSSMADAGALGTTWVPRLGDVEVPPERVDLIRGLLELAAFVANHPELPLPWVDAVMIPGGATNAEGVRVVADAADALGVAAAFGDGNSFVARRRFGLVTVRCVLRLAPPDAADRREVVAGEAR
jgi:hypothetical protein